MTNEEAIRMLKAKLACLSMDTSDCYSECNEELCDECPLNYEQGNMGEQKEYIRMSIEALERKSCEDAISRQAVLDEIENYSCLDKKDIKTIIKALPPVTPQPKTGHWVFVDKAKEHAHCSECDYGNVDLLDGRPHNYCPQCGSYNGGGNNDR